MEIGEIFVFSRRFSKKTPFPSHILKKLLALSIPRIEITNYIFVCVIDIDIAKIKKKKEKKEKWNLAAI